MGWVAVVVFVLVIWAGYAAGWTLTIGGLALLLAVALSARWTVFTPVQHRRMRWRVRLHLSPGRGFASLPELWLRWGGLPAIWGHGRRARPGMSLAARIMQPTSQCAIRLGRGNLGKRLYSRQEDHVLIYAPPRVAKTGLLGDWVIDWPGAAVVHESRPGLLAATAGYRARLGAVPGVNPAGAGGVPSTFRWALTVGCEDPAEASYRASDLVGAVAEGEMAWWVEKATAALAAAFHAAGLLGLDMGAVAVWAASPGAATPLVQAAMRHPGAQSPESKLLFAALTELERPGKTSDSIKITLSKSMMFMGNPALAAMVTGAGAVPFDVPAWIEERGTIYLVSPGGEEAPSAPLMRCFASYVQRQAKMYALRLPGGRLDPRLGFFLDELHRCPVALPAWLGDSAGAGIEIVAVVHSTGQLEEKYGRAGLKTVWATTGTKVFLPGIQDPDTLRDIAELSGRLPGDQGDGRDDWVAPVAFIRVLPNWRALVLRLNLFPVVVKVRPFWRRPAFRLRANPAPPVLRQAEARPYDVDAELGALVAAGAIPPGRASGNGDGPPDIIGNG